MRDKICHGLLLSQRNSAQRLMAEAILNCIGRPHFVAYSVGFNPAGDIDIYRTGCGLMGLSGAPKVTSSALVQNGRMRITSAI